MAEEVGGEGNILVVEGIPGYSASDSQNAGVLDGLSRYPGIKVTGQIAHMWTSQVGQAETQKWLATNLKIREINKTPTLPAENLLYRTSF